MKFSEIIEQASDLLHRKGRFSYRTLKLEFDLSDEQLDALKEELIEVQELAADKDGKMLVWVGAVPVVSSQLSVVSPQPPIPHTQPPAAYTPSHLTERIRATPLTEDERKTITALFADLKGSTALIEGLDPEEARAIIDPALQLMMDAVHSYDGYVAQALGDASPCSVRRWPTKIIPSGQSMPRYGCKRPCGVIPMGCEPRDIRPC